MTPRPHARYGRRTRGIELRRRVRVPLYLAYLAVATAVLLELGVRLSGFAERHFYDPIYRRFEGGADIPYVHKPNLVGARARGLVVLDTDALGLRTTTPGERLAAKVPGEFRIAVAGDSVTFGEGVPRTEETFVQVLERELDRAVGRAAVRVFNFGVSAYSVREMAASLEHRMMDVEPDLVVLALIPSDFRLSRTPGVDDDGFLVHADDWWLRASAVRDALRSIHLPYLVREVRVRWQRRNRPTGLDEGRIPESYAWVRRFRDVAAGRGVPHLVVLLPQLRERAWGVLPSQLARDGIAHVDLSALVTDLPRADFTASRFDPHPSPAVHGLIGRALAAHLGPAVEAALERGGPTS